MKKKILLGSILFVSLFVSVFSFTNSSYAYTKKSNEFVLTVEQENDLLKAYDLNHDGKISSRDVSKMKQLVAKGNKDFTAEECILVQRYVVKEMPFKWMREIEADSFNELYKNISSGKILYFDYFSNGSSKLIVHVNKHGTFYYYSYDYAKHNGR